VNYLNILKDISYYNSFLSFNNKDKLNFIIKALDRALNFSFKFKEDSYLRSLISSNIKDLFILEFLLKLRYLVLIELNKSNKDLYTSLYNKLFFYFYFLLLYLLFYFIIY
jgi:hypothetical protein